MKNNVLLEILLKTKGILIILFLVYILFFNSWITIKETQRKLIKATQETAITEYQQDPLLYFIQTNPLTKVKK